MFYLSTSLADSGDSLEGFFIPESGVFGFLMLSSSIFKSEWFAPEACVSKMLETSGRFFIVATRTDYTRSSIAAFYDLIRFERFDIYF